MKLNLRVEFEGELLLEMPLRDGLTVSLCDEAGTVLSNFPARRPAGDAQDDQVVAPGTGDPDEKSELQSGVDTELIVMTESPGTESVPGGAKLEERSAEVWSRDGEDWSYQGTLSSGQQARMGEGHVRLDEDGGLRVFPGTRLGGLAILPTGGRVSIKPGGPGVQLLAGSCVTLGCGSRSFYVRSNFIDQPPVEHAGEQGDRLESRYRAPTSDLH